MEERALRTLIELGHGVLEELELEPVLQRVLAVARELTGARYAAIGVLDSRRTEFEKTSIIEQIRPSTTDHSVFIATQSGNWAQMRRADRDMEA